MKAGDFGTRGLHKIAPYQRVVIKSQKKIDMGPFIRYSCWHCENPPCAGRCPFKAIKKEAERRGQRRLRASATRSDPQVHAAVRAPTASAAATRRSASADVTAGDDKAFKCTLCYGRAGASATRTATCRRRPATTDGYVSMLDEWLAPAARASYPSSRTGRRAYDTCPAKAMTLRHAGQHQPKLRCTAHAAGKLFYAMGDGSMFWVPAKYVLAAPKADPFIEDHVTPMVSGHALEPARQGGDRPDARRRRSAGAVGAPRGEREGSAVRDGRGGVSAMRRLALMLA